MKTEPLVTVVIPLYNHRLYVEEALKSIFRQTFKDIEIIIVDDGSTDGSSEWCLALSKEYPAVRYIRQENQGAHCALNRGIELSKSRYISILNSDDCFTNYKIDRCLQIVRQHPDVEFVFGDVEFIDREGKLLTLGLETDWQNRALDFFHKSKLLALSLLNENFCATTSNMFFSKEAWLQIKGFQPLRYCHDLDFLMSAIRTTQCFFDKETTHVYYRCHAENTIKEDLRRIKIEIGAVIIDAFVQNSSSLIGHDFIRNGLVFNSFLKNKDISELLLALALIRNGCDGRNQFYNIIREEQMVSSLLNFIR